MLCFEGQKDVSSQAGGGGVETVGGAHCEEGVGVFRAHGGHCSFTLCGERIGQKEDHG